MAGTMLQARSSLVPTSLGVSLQKVQRAPRTLNAKTARTLRVGCAQNCRPTRHLVTSTGVKLWSSRGARSLCRAEEASAGDASTMELTLAAQENDFRMVDVLTGMGADIDAGMSEARTTPSSASGIGIADLSKQVDEEGFTALHYAASKGFTNVVKLLCERGVDTNKEDPMGYKPLHMAAAEGFPRIMELLADANADVNAVDMDGFTPLHMAAAEGHIQAVEMLLQKGADYQLTDSQGSTPLHIAATNGFADVVKLMADKGANLDFEDNLGNTPMENAVASGHVEVVQVLIAAGVDVTVVSGRSEKLIKLGGGFEDVMRVLIKGGLDEAHWRTDPAKKYGWKSMDDGDA